MNDYCKYISRFWNHGFSVHCAFNLLIVVHSSYEVFTCVWVQISSLRKSSTDYNTITSIWRALVFMFQYIITLVKWSFVWKSINPNVQSNMHKTCVYLSTLTCSLRQEMNIYSFFTLSCWDIYVFMWIHRKTDHECFFLFEETHSDIFKGWSDVTHSIVLLSRVPVTLRP